MSNITFEMLEEGHLISLIDEEDREVEFELVARMEIDDDFYYAITPLDDSGSYMILKSVLEEETGEELLATIDDEEEYDYVGELFSERLAEYEDELFEGEE